MPTGIDAGEDYVDARDLDLVREDLVLQGRALHLIELGSDLQRALRDRAAGIENDFPWTSDDLPNFRRSAEEAVLKVREHRARMIAAGVTPGPIRSQPVHDAYEAAGDA